MLLRECPFKSGCHSTHGNVFLRRLGSQTDGHYLLRWQHGARDEQFVIEYDELLESRPIPTALFQPPSSPESLKLHH